VVQPGETGTNFATPVTLKTRKIQRHKRTRHLIPHINIGMIFDLALRMHVMHQ